MMMRNMKLVCLSFVFLTPFFVNQCEAAINVALSLCTGPGNNGALAPIVGYDPALCRSPATKCTRTDGALMQTAAGTQIIISNHPANCSACLGCPENGVDGACGRDHTWSITTTHNATVSGEISGGLSAAVKLKLQGGYSYKNTDTTSDTVYIGPASETIAACKTGAWNLALTKVTGISFKVNHTYTVTATVFHDFNIFNAPCPVAGATGTAVRRTTTSTITGEDNDGTNQTGGITGDCT